jgi:uncharacterized protein
MVLGVPKASKMAGNPPLATTFVLKIAELCNLNCSYCYMYNKGDSSFRLRPKFMSREVAEAMLARIASYGQRHNLRKIAFALHGGEPLLIGTEWVQWFLERAHAIGSSAGIAFAFGIQTNGTLLDQDWVDLLSTHKVMIGVSCDGPEEWNDLSRSDFAGGGSYSKIRAAIELLAATRGADWGVLTVVNPLAPPRAVLKHFVDLGVDQIDFLWPEYNHDSAPPWPTGALANYYCELFDYWYNELPSPPKIRWFTNAMVLLLGGRSDCDVLGTNPVTDIMVESDGSWEPLDTLRICGDGMTRTGLDVRRSDVEEIWKAPLYQIGLRSQELLSEQCQSCSYRRICGGGYLPHRYSRDNGFANPSVHCGDLLAVLSHIRQKIADDLAELREATAAMAEQ